jgi:hypothetical protein
VGVQVERGGIFVGSLGFCLFSKFESDAILFVPYWRVRLTQVMCS